MSFKNTRRAEKHKPGPLGAGRSPNTHVPLFTIIPNPRTRQPGNGEWGRLTRAIFIKRLHSKPKHAVGKFLGTKNGALGVILRGVTVTGQYSEKYV
jgi:hypothetical protein